MRVFHMVERPQATVYFSWHGRRETKRWGVLYCHCPWYPRTSWMSCMLWFDLIYCWSSFLFVLSCHQTDSWIAGCSPSACSGKDKVVGFGYLHSKREYKVVSFFYRGPSHSFWDGQLKHLRCEVLTLNEVGGISNGWKRIVKTSPCHLGFTGLLVNKCLY